MTPGILCLSREVKRSLGVRWDLTPMSDENENGTNQSLWTEAYRNLQMARKKVAQRYNEGRKDHRYVLVIQCHIS